MQKTDMLANKLDSLDNKARQIRNNPIMQLANGYEKKLREQIDKLSWLLSSLSAQYSAVIVEV